MELYDIVDAASTHLKEGTLILHRSMKVHPKFKVYKIFCYDLYYVKQKEKTLLFSHEEVKNIPTDEIDKIWNDCDRLYLRKLTKWFAGEKYKSMLKDGV